MNPFSKRIHQIKNPDLDLPKGTRNPFLDLQSVFGFTERNTPIINTSIKKLFKMHHLCCCDTMIASKEHVDTGVI